MKSHQVGKVLHWQIALVRPKHLPKGKRSMSHFPRHSVARLRLPVSLKGWHIYVLRTLQYPAALSLLFVCNALLQRETSACPGLLPGMYLKSEGAEMDFVLEALLLLSWHFTASELAHHSTARFLLEDRSWGPVSMCCGQCEYLE